MCRHWRGILLKHGALWSQLFLRRGEECVSTLLKRAKGSALDIFARYDDPDGTTALISPRAQQIRYLEFITNHWKDIIMFSEFNSGKLPLLRTLRIIYPTIIDSDGQPNTAVPPSLPFFEGSVNLGQFVFFSRNLSYLSHFIFPNLTTFELASRPGEECSASYLFDFLKASPLLQTVKVKITAKVVLRGIPQETVVVLPNVKTLSLHVDDGPTTYVSDIATHISCPRARNMSLINGMDDIRTSPDLKIFPTPIPWSTIVHQHTTNSVEEVTLQIKNPTSQDIESFLTFRSSDAIIVRLGFNIDETDADEDELNMPRAEMGWEIFSQALRAIRDHSLLSHVKRLQFEYRAAISDTYGVLRRAAEILEILGSLGPLDALTICGCDLHVFLADFLHNPVLDESDPIVFPRVNQLTILHPVMEEDEFECMNAIVGLAQSQHALGIPFERVTVRRWSLPTGMAEELGRWVGAVDCCEEWYTGEQDV